MLINGIKFACYTCVKGHRSSTCNHIERPLFEIRKKGRPVTQCSYCRDLRKTKQVHIKCTCKSKTTQQQQQQQQPQQYSSTSTTAVEGGISYPDIIQNSSINEPSSWQQSSSLDTTPVLSQENGFQRSISTSSINYSSRKMSRKSSSSSSSRRSTISAPYTVQQQQQLPFIRPQQFTNQPMDLPKQISDISTTMGLATADPDELSLLLNNIFMNKDDMKTPISSSSQPMTQGESVVITITPLSSSEMPVSRIVTCYCGNSCKCPGCFVHPANNYDKLLAPTDNQIIAPYYSSYSSDDENIIY